MESIKEYASLKEGFVESSRDLCPQFIHRDKCGCTFLHHFRNGIWETPDREHRVDCLWKK